MPRNSPKCIFVNSEILTLGGLNYIIIIFISYTEYNIVPLVNSGILILVIINCFCICLVVVPNRVSIDICVDV